MILQSEFPATHSATTGGNLQPPAGNSPVSSQGGRVRPGRCQWRLRIVIPVGCSCHEFRAHSDSADVAPVQ